MVAMKLLLALSLALASCTSVGPSPTPQIVYVTPSPAPTLAVTPSPSPTPTPVPTPTKPSGTSFITFLDHVISNIEVKQPLLDDAISALRSSRYGESKRAVDRLADQNSDEIKWVLAHPPLPCYQRVYDKYLDSLFSYADAFDALSYGLTEPVTLSDISRGVTLTQEGNALLQESTDALDLVATGCL
jgi:hypothetical protein